MIKVKPDKFTDSLIEMVWDYIGEPDKYINPAIGIWVQNFGLERAVCIEYGEQYEMHLPRPSAIYPIEEFVWTWKNVTFSTAHNAGISDLAPNEHYIEELATEWLNML